jgi:hypothetical protein
LPNVGLRARNELIEDVGWYFHLLPVRWEVKLDIKEQERTHLNAMVISLERMALAGGLNYDE